MIAGCSINGFKKTTVGIYSHDESSDEKVAGTVDGETFRNWLSKRICPILGYYCKVTQIALQSWIILQHICLMKWVT